MERPGGERLTESEGVSGVWPAKGGPLRITVVPGAGRNRIAAVRFGGVLEAGRDPGVEELEKALADSGIDEAPGRIEDYFSRNPQALPGVEPEDVMTVLSLAFAKVRRASSQAPDPGAWKQPPPA
jgi:hypothetical protein